jgi:hypothetical protein
LPASGASDDCSIASKGIGSFAGRKSGNWKDAQTEDIKRDLSTESVKKGGCLGKGILLFLFWIQGSFI